MAKKGKIDVYWGKLVGEKGVWRIVIQDGKIVSKMRSPYKDDAIPEVKIPVVHSDGKWPADDRLQ